MSAAIAIKAYPNPTTVATVVLPDTPTMPLIKILLSSSKKQKPYKTHPHPLPN